MKKAIVIVDMLNDFARNDEKYQGKLFVQGSRGIIENIKAIKEVAKKAGVPVIYANDAHEPDDKEFEKWPEHAVKGTYGAKIIDELVATEKNVVCEKQDLSVFTNAAFDEYLAKEGIEELIVTGVATDYCVRAIALETKSKYGELIPGAIDRRYNVTVVVDAIAGVDEIVLPDGSSVLKSKGAVAKSLLEMGSAGVKPVYTSDVLEGKVI